MNVFCISVPHSQTSPKWNICPHTMKILNFIKILKMIGYNPIHLGTEGAEVDCEHIDVQSIDQFNKYFKDMAVPNNKLPDPSVKIGYHDVWYKNVNDYLLKNSTEDDLICIPWGSGHHHCLNNIRCKIVEIGIGYLDTLAPFKVYQSYAWKSYNYALKDMQDKNANSKRFFDTVIPNFYDPEHFALGEGGPHFGFMGRLEINKGVEIALQATEAINAKLIYAGQGDSKQWKRKHSEYIGILNIERRKSFLGSIKALFVPTIYVEPFGGVAVEAMMCGTPVISSDWGVFPETVVHNKTGFRCTTLDQFVYAAKNVDKLDRKEIQKYALENYSLRAAVPRFKEYLEHVINTNPSPHYINHNRTFWEKPYNSTNNI